MADRHPGEDAVLDLVLAEGDEREREETRAHLPVCEACGREHAELAEGLRLVLPAAPAIAPPPGFEASVLTALRSAQAGAVRAGEPGSAAEEPGWAAEEPGWAAGEPARSRRRLGPRHGRRTAVAAAVGLVVGVAGAAVVLDRSRPDIGPDRGADATPSAFPAEVGAVGPALRTADGSRVGTVLESQFDGKPVLVVTITEGTPGMRYDCDLLLADGRRVAAGSWVLPDPPGVTWVVPEPEGDDVVGLELIADTGRTWATASFAAR